MNETVRRTLLWVASLVGWSYTVAIATWATVNFDPSKGHFAPQWVGLSAFISMGIAIAAGVTLGRMSSLRTLAQIFEAGMIAQRLEDEKAKDDDE